MNSVLSSVGRRSLALISRHKFHSTPFVGQKKAQESKVQETSTSPIKLYPIETDSYFLKKHNNCKRQYLYDFGLYVGACLPKYVQQVQMQHNDELEILVAPEGMFQVLSFMAHHQHACFNQCSATTAIDVPSRVFRFEVAYMLLSMRFGARCRVKTYTDELTPLHSAYSLWKVCDWFERELYDMFGVVFTHHPDLRRMLTDYGFTGHPLRKDFPMVGYTEVRYDDGLKKLVYEPVEFAQEMRHYDLTTPWNYFNTFHQGYSNPPGPPKKN